MFLQSTMGLNFSIYIWLITNHSFFTPVTLAILRHLLIFFLYSPTPFSMPEAPVPDATWVTDQFSGGATISSVSVGEVIGNAIPLQPSSRRIKFLIEWKERTIPIVLDETETIGTVDVVVEVLNP